MFGTRLRGPMAASVITSLTLLDIILVPCVCRAEIPRTIALNGILASAAGAPKPNGSYTVSFRLFNVPTGGTALWAEADKTVTVFGGTGQFSTLLGSQVPFGALAFDQPYYLEMQVSGDLPMAPRMPLASVPYALSSSSGTATLSLPFAGSASVASPGSALKVANTGNGLGITSEAPANIGVQGISNTWVGVWGTSQTSAGVQGVSDAWVGVGGKSNSGAGVYGESSAWAGVWGQSVNSTGVVGKSEKWEGVHGESVADKGVYGGSSGWVGVWGHSDTSTGVFGESKGGRGVHGQSLTGPGVFGESVGDSQGGGDHGVVGIASTLNRAGVYGESKIGGYGVQGVGNGWNSPGVFGYSRDSTGVRGVTGTGAGMFARADDPNGIGVRAESATGVRGELASLYGQQPAGVYGVGIPSGWAGAFFGNVYVTGTIAAAQKNFRIDHPLDPANKFLVHTCTEGPEPLDVYSGNVTTDAQGVAEVRLPGYFEALNTDYRYQLTVVDGEDSDVFAQTKVARTIRDNRFTIRTDRPNVTVSWQVTGVRNDAYMRAHPSPVEEMKPADQRGRYLDPESFGQPREKGIGYIPPSPNAATGH